MLYIIIGRNSGYPCVPETGELPETNLVPPFPLNSMIISANRNNGYPQIRSVPELPENVKFIYPYIYSIMRIIGNDFNNGYPCIPGLENAEIKIDSNLMFNSLPVTGMYFKKEKIKNAFCGERPVYRVYWRINS